MSHKNRATLFFNNNSGVSWSIFILFVPVETGRNTLQSGNHSGYADDIILLVVCVCVTLLFTAIAETLDSKICVAREKKLILDCLEDERLCQRLTLMKHEARVHVVAMKQINITVCCLAGVSLII